METHIKGLVITTLGVLFIVPDALFVRLIAADPLTIAFWRNLLSGLAIALWVFAVHGRSGFRATFAQGPLIWLYCLFMGLTGILFVSAVSLTSVANVVFILASLPVFSAILSRIFLKETLSRRTSLTIVVVIIGLGVISLGSGMATNGQMLGNLLALCVAICYATAMTIARNLRAVSVVPAVPVAYFGAAILLMPFTDIWQVDAASIPLVAIHGSVFIALATVFLALGPRYLSSPEVGLLILLESALAPLLVWAVLGEQPGTMTLVGGAIVLGALFLSNLLMVMKRAA